MGKTKQHFWIIIDKCGLWIQGLLGLLVSAGAAILLSHSQYYINNYLIGNEKDFIFWWSAAMPSIIVSGTVIFFGLMLILAMQSRTNRTDKEDRHNETQRIIDAIRESRDKRGNDDKGNTKITKDS